MNTLAVLLCVAAAAVQCSGLNEQAFKQNQRECFAQYKVSSRVSDRISRNDWTVVDKSMNEWSRCVLRKAGLLTKTDAFVIESTLDKLPNKERNSVIDIIDGCLQNLPSTKDLPWYFTKCYRSKTSRAIF